jgi:hypothetical protein
MKVVRFALLALLVVVPSLHAVEPVPPSSRDTFPSDFKPSPCAPDTSCVSFDRSKMKSAAFSFLGLSLEQSWVDAHAPEMEALFAPYCRKQATCLATPGNGFLFCDDAVMPELRTVCERRFPASVNAHDAEQCDIYTETWALGVDQMAKKIWENAQKCVAEKIPTVEHSKPLDIWMAPETLSADNKGYVTFYSIDRDTHVPVPADVKIGKQIIYAPSNPAGSVQTYYPVKLPIKFVRVPNAEGHTTLVPPKVVVTAPHYPTTEFPLPVAVPQVRVTMTPPVSEFKTGSNKVTITAVDAATGKPVELRVMLGETIGGDSNKPFEYVKTPGQKRPEIWVTSLFDKYSDQVVAPAEK